MRIIGGVLLSLLVSTAQAQSTFSCDTPRVVTYIKTSLLSDWSWDDDNLTPTRVEVDEDTITTLEVYGKIQMCAATVRGFGPEVNLKFNESKPTGGTRPDVEYDHDIYYRVVTSDNGKSYWFDYIEKADTIWRPK